MRLPFGRKALSADAGFIDSLQQFGGGYFSFPRSSFVDGAFVQAQGASYSAIYASQANVRTVVDHIAEIVGSRALQVFEMQPDGDTVGEAMDHPAARTIQRPNGWTDDSGLIGSFVRDYLIWDNAYLWDMGPVDNGERLLLRVPPYAMGVRGPNLMKPSGYRVLFNSGEYIDLAISEVIHLCGYSGVDARIGTSKLETLRTDLMEESVRRAQTIEFIRGGMVRGGLIQRPLEAPEWSDQARERFETSWAQRLKGLAAGGRSPVLEEGMVFVDAGVTPKEAEVYQMRQLALETVARIYGLHPALFIGTDVAGLGPAREAREEDVIVPLLTKISAAFNRQIIDDIYQERGQYSFRFAPRKDTDPGKIFTASKNATASSVLTVNEFRERYMGLGPVEGGDKLTLNPGATQGGAPPTEPPLSTDDRGQGDPPEGKALLHMPTHHAILARRDDYAAKHAELMRGYFRRQAKSIANGSRADSERWNRELASDLLDLAKATVREEGNVVAAKVMSTFDMGKVENYLTAGAKAFAGAVNAQTQALIEGGLKATGPDAPKKPTRGEVIAAVLSPERADNYGLTRATGLAAFATREAGAQSGSPRLKRWISSGLPDSRHADLNGQTTQLFTEFGNGLQYPGDPDGDPGDTVNCACALDIV